MENPGPDAKRILITGSARGIGLAAAKALVQRGACVTIGARDAAKAEAAAREAGCEWVGLDVLDADSCRRAADAIRERWGRLDVLANNAAILLDHFKPLLETEPEVLSRTFETNVAGALRVVQAFLPLLEKSASPRIVNVSSGAGQLNGEPAPYAPAYSVSKTALNMLTQQLSTALPGFAVNSMCPGWCRTEMGGAEAPRTAEQGADTLVWLAMDASQDETNGFFRDRQRIDW